MLIFVVFMLFSHKIHLGIDVPANSALFWLYFPSPGVFWKPLEASWARLGASWRPLGASLGRLGSLLAHFGASWVRLGASWLRLGASGRVLNPKKPPT